MDANEQYSKFAKALETLKEEYKIMPSSFLLKQIELVEKKLKQIDESIKRGSSGGGNYPSKT